MKKYNLQKAIMYKLFMGIAFLLFCSVMYQGHMIKGGIYSILFFISLFLIAFQIASIFYVLFIKREFKILIDENSISWNFSDNGKIYKENLIHTKDIQNIKTEIEYLMGNIYSRFNITFELNDGNQIVLTDGLLYDFGIKNAEDICKFLLENNLGDTQDIKFMKLINELNIDLNKEQVFNKKDGKSYYVGVISKHKKEFLSLRLQIEALYKEYNIVKKNMNNEYLVKTADKKDSFIHLKSNAIGYFIEFHNTNKKEEIKSLKQLGKRDKIGFFN